MANYYVAPIGTSGAGTIGNPWGIPDLLTGTSPVTQGVALTTLQPADTLYFRGGMYNIAGDTVSYNNQLISPTNSGTAGNPITLQPYPGEAVNIVVTTGRQSAFGTLTPLLNYVRFLGFTIDPGPGNALAADTLPPAFYVSGTNNEIGYCEIIGRVNSGSDNHAGIYLQDANLAWIHNNNIHSVTGSSHNSCGIELYRDTLAIIEDNYIHGNTNGVFDKDAGTALSGTQNTFRRNWIVGNALYGFLGSNQQVYSLALDYLYDNVTDEQINIGTGGTGAGTQVYNNLVVLADVYSTLVGCTAANIFQANIWNNITINSGNPTFGYWNSSEAFTPSGSTAPVTFMDCNVYDGTPSYLFSGGTLSLATFQGDGFETNAHQDTVGNIFVDQISYVLKTAYQTAGIQTTLSGPSGVRGAIGGQVGPRSMSPVGPTNVSTANSVASILDTARYGPAAMPGAPTGIALQPTVMRPVSDRSGSRRLIWAE